MAPLNVFASVWLPPAAPQLTAEAADEEDVSTSTPAVLLCDLPQEVLHHILRALPSPEDVCRAVASCRALWAVAPLAALHLRIALPLQSPQGAPPPALPRQLAAAPWLRGVVRLDLSGAFLAEEEVVAALERLPRLAHLSLTGCQKVLGDATVCTALRAPALRSFSVSACWSFSGAAAATLLSACLHGGCPLRSLLLGNMALDCGSLLLPAAGAAGEAADAVTTHAATAAAAGAPCELRVLGLLSCALAGARHAPAALARATKLRVLLLSGSTFTGGAAAMPAVMMPSDGDDVDADGDAAAAAAEAAAAPPLPEAPCAAPHAQLARALRSSLVALEVTQTTACLLDAGDAAPEVWDLLCAQTAMALAALGARRLRARLLLRCTTAAGGEEEEEAEALTEEDVTSALACAASAPGGPRRAAPLHAASSRADAGGAHVAALLCLGARADARDVTGATPLFVAAEAGHAEACDALLAAGAALDVRTTSGEGPAYIAALKGRAGAARALLAAAAARRVPPRALANDDGWSPLHAAAVAGRPPMLALCAAAAAADADAKARGALDGVNRFGQTALHIAARRGCAEMCAMLLAAGAASGVRDERGAAPADVAARHGHAELAGVLRAAAARGGGGSGGAGPHTRRKGRQRAAAVAPVR
jgi:hypothetical protein